MTGLDNRNTCPVPVLHPYLGKDVPWLLESQAESRGEQVFLVWEDFDHPPQQWTYEAFWNEVRGFAAGLAGRGLGVGDAVLIHMDNCPEFLVGWFACAVIGAIAVTTNTRYAPDELNYAINHARVRVALTQPQYLDLVHGAGCDLEFIAVTGVPGAGQKERVVAWPQLQLHSEPPARAPDPMLPLSVQYTSGTTARPKGVVWTHANGLWCGQINTQHFLLTEADIAMTVFPLFHTNALGYSVLGTLWSGGTVVLQPKFSASRYWDVVVRNQCTWSSINGFVMQALSDLPVPSHKLRYWPIGVGDVEFVEKHFGVKLIGMWGMTETVGHGIISYPQVKGREGAIGMVAPEYEIAVRDKHGADLQPDVDGVTGRLLIRGVPGLTIFKEYLHDPQATANCFDDDGWFETGDLVTIFTDGSIVFSDREKDMLKIGAENVAASEIERVVQSVPGIAEVAVVGRPDRMLDEVPVVFVRAPEEGFAELAEAISAACEAQLADFKRPREVIRVDDFPRSTIDKISKKELRARFE